MKDSDLVRYNLPKGMRYSTLEERKEFYEEEFNATGVEEWFNNNLNNVVFAVVMGRHTRVYPPKYKSDASTTILIDDYQTLNDLKDWLLEFLPESVYYDRNIYDEHEEVKGQQMAFDLDPENMECPIHGTLEERMQREQGLSFCKTALEKVKEKTIQLYHQLKQKFSKIKIVYSGRGYHLHILDKTSFEWNAEKRKRFANHIAHKGFPIDAWVTSGSMRLIRLPYSLHGIVSRIVTPLTLTALKTFDPIKEPKCLPRFLYSK
ncbi:MAG: DNA primase [Thermoproteota archaeon]